MEKRLRNLESISKVKQRSKYALIICDSETLHSFDFSLIEADSVLILPDNGHRLPKNQLVPKGSYVVRYS